MSEVINDIINSKQFKTKRERNAFLLDAGYSIDEIFNICDIKPSKKAIAFEKLVTIIEIMNEGWYPNWNDDSEYKYFPYFDMSGNKCVFSFWFTANYITLTNVPSALCLKTKELVEYMVTHYMDLYKDLYE